MRRYEKGDSQEGSETETELDGIEDRVHAKNVF